MKNDKDFDHDEWDIVQPDPIEIKIGRFVGRVVGRYVLVPLILSLAGMAVGAIVGFILGGPVIPVFILELEGLKLWQVGALVGFIYGVVK